MIYTTCKNKKQISFGMLLDRPEENVKMKDFVFQLFAIFGAGTIGYLIGKPLATKFIKVIDNWRDSLWDKIHDYREQAKNGVDGKYKINNSPQLSSDNLAPELIESEYGQNGEPLSQNADNPSLNPIGETTASYQASLLKLIWLAVYNCPNKVATKWKRYPTAKTTSQAYASLLKRMRQEIYDCSSKVAMRWHQKHLISNVLFNCKSGFQRFIAVNHHRWLADDAIQEKIILKLRIYLLNALALSMGICLLFNFVSIWRYGKYYMYESNPFILSIETLMMVVIILFSLYCLYCDFINRSSNRTNE